MICIEDAKCFCTDYTKIENYEEAISDKTQTWDCHHRNERFYSSQELKDLGLYYDCPPCELIFLKVPEHKKQYHKGAQHTEDWNEKISKSMKGKQTWWKGKHHSEEAKKKIGEKSKNRKHTESSRKKMSESAKKRASNTLGKHWKLIDGKHVYY